MTNYDKIKQMSLEEMADFLTYQTDILCEFCEHYDLYKRPYGCEVCDYATNEDVIKEWLKREAEE